MNPGDWWKLGERDLPACLSLARTDDEVLYCLGGYVAFETPPLSEPKGSVLVLPRPKSEIEARRLYGGLRSVGNFVAYEHGDVAEVHYTRTLSDEDVDVIRKASDFRLRPTAEINFDIDPPDAERKAREVVSKLSQIFDPDRIWVRRSASGTGFHVRVDAEVPPDIALSIREAFGDDPRRVEIDWEHVEHGIQPGFLYDVKMGQRAGEWRKASEIFL